MIKRRCLDFGIMYDGEQDAGNDVRRVGEEGLKVLQMERLMPDTMKVRGVWRGQSGRCFA